MTKFRLFVLACFAAVLAFGFLFLRAYYIDVGRGLERAKHNEKVVNDLTTMIKENKGLVAASAAASMAMASARSDWLKTSETTTRSMKDALQKTASSRAGCVFDRDSLRHLDAARERAAAASSGGLRANTAAAAGAGR
jgi:hypothetical protein